MTLKTINKITLAYWFIGDYFSRMGGGARYRNMPESDIPLLVGCELARRCIKGFETGTFLSSQLIDASKPVLDELTQKLDVIMAEYSNVTEALVEFMNSVDEKYQPHHRSPRWDEFLSTIRTPVLTDQDGNLEDSLLMNCERK